MADRSERELERRAAAGDVDAEGQLLARRLRRGEVDVERLKLAADLGHAPSCAALERPFVMGTLQTWLTEIHARWGRWLVARVALALAELQLPGANLEAGDAKPTLVVPSAYGENAPRVPLSETPVRIGRAQGQVDVLVDEGSVSREHCEVWLDAEGVVWLRDLGSSNGTHYRGQPVFPETPVPLERGACFFAGRLPLLIDCNVEPPAIAARQLRCLLALRAWVDQPSSQTSTIVRAAALNLVSTSLLPPTEDLRAQAGRVALRSALDAVLCAPFRAGAYVLRSRLDPETWQRAIAQTLCPQLLEGAPLPHVSEPQYAASVISPSDFDWLGRALGVEVLGLVARASEGPSSGRVFMARDPSRDALRLLTWFPARDGRLRHDYQEAFKRLERLARRAGSSLAQPSLTRNVGMGMLSDGGVVFLSEFVPGLPLSTWARETQPSTSEAVSLVIALATSLQPALEAGVVLRDLHSEDVIVEVPGDQPLVPDPLLRAWGEASEEVERALHVSGKAISVNPGMVDSALRSLPEDVQGSLPSCFERDDAARWHPRLVFQLGMILHGLVSGLHPSQLPESQRARRDVPHDLRAALTRALDRDPARRFARIDEFVRALEPFASERVPLEDLDARQLVERAARGDTGAEVALLTLGVDGGRLSRERLDLAADLGYGPARLARGDEEDDGELGFGAWLKRIAPWGRRVRVGVAVEITRMHLPGLTRASGESLWLQVVGTSSAADACAAAPLLRGDSLSVGREAGSDLLLTDHTVSRFHCRVGWGEAGLFVVDLGSTSGTVVDGEVCGGDARSVAEGALIRVGGTHLKLQRTLPQPASALEPFCLECLRTGERWLSDPGPAVAQEAQRLRVGRPSSGGSTETLNARMAALGILRAILGSSLRADHYALGSPDERRRWRLCVAETIGPRVLRGGQHPLPPDADPPAECEWPSQSEEVGGLRAEAPDHERLERLQQRWNGVASYGVQLARLDVEPPRYLVLDPAGEQLVVTQLGGLPPQRGVIAAYDAEVAELMAALPPEARLALPGETRRVHGGLLVSRRHVEGDPLPPRWGAVVPQCVRLVQALARGLSEAAHGLLIGGSVRRENVWLAADGPWLVGLEEDRARVRLLDGGEGTEDSLPRLRSVAPEAVKFAEAYTEQSLVFELAGVLYELLTGRALLCEVTSVREIVRRALEPGWRPTPPSSLAPGIHSALDAVVLRALNVRPNERHAGALAFADALERFAR